MPSFHRKKQDHEVYTIALGGPWQLSCSQADFKATLEHASIEWPAAAQRIRIPEDWPLLHRLARRHLRLRRRFHRPNNLDATQRVFVCLRGWPCGAKVLLNGQTRGSITDAHATAAFDVTDQLKPLNDLEMEWHAGAMLQLGPDPASAAIEIRRQVV